MQIQRDLSENPPEKHGHFYEQYPNSDKSPTSVRSWKFLGNTPTWQRKITASSYCVTCLTLLLSE